MRGLIYSYTDRGQLLAQSIIRKTSDNSLRKITITEAISNKPVASDFDNNDALIFVGSAGIAVRMIAPFVRDKLKDPAVIVISEDGRFVIPILSGHVGGANELAEDFAKLLGAIPVITTATDINGIIAVDELARTNNLDIVNRDNIKKISAGLLKGQAKNIVLSDDVLITADESEIDKEVLGLVFRPIVVGIGLRKGKDFDSLEKFFLESLNECLGEGEESVKKVAALVSIDVKKEEPALIRLSQEYDIPLYFYSAEELKAVEGDFESSDFVERTVGVGDVSARAARALGKRGKFLIKKKKQDGMTISIFEKLARVTFQY